jgi:diguanylate cyclase
MKYCCPLIVFRMSALNPITLMFKSLELERAFMAKNFPRTLAQGRIGLVLGTLLYMSFGLVDQWSIPEAHHFDVWVIRFSAICVPIIIFGLTFTPVFRLASHVFLAALGLAANVGFLFMLPLIPLEQLGLFYPGVVLTTIAGYCLVGTRFIYALAVEVGVLIAYNFVFIGTHGLVPSTLFTHDFFIISANVIGGVAGYLQEFQTRKLFLREQELEQERQKHLDRSLRDPLTGLANRELLQDRIHQAIAESKRDGTGYAGFFIDLDGFKKINDNQGHEFGDKVLQAVAAQLSIAVRESDTVARLGGDEFFVVCKGIDSSTQAMVHARRLLGHIEASYVEGLAKDALSASIGICFSPHTGISVKDVIARADKAMYKAKQSGRGNCVIAESSLQLVAAQSKLQPESLNA